MCVCEREREIEGECVRERGRWHHEKVVLFQSHPCNLHFSHVGDERVRVRERESERERDRERERGR